MILYIQYSWWVTSLVYHVTAVTLLICSYSCAVQNEMLRCTADSHIWTSCCSKGSNSPHRHGVMTCCMPLIAFGRLEDWMCLYFKGCWAQVSPKVLLPHSRWGILTPHLIDMWFLVLVWVCPGMAFQLVKPAFCNAGGCDQHTDRQTVPSTACGNLQALPRPFTAAALQRCIKVLLNTCRAVVDHSAHSSKPAARCCSSR